jgi:hypothetical protein
MNSPDDGGSKDLWNVDKLLPDYMVLQSKTQPLPYCHENLTPYFFSTDLIKIINMKTWNKSEQILRAQYIVLYCFGTGNTWISIYSISF